MFTAIGITLALVGLIFSWPFVAAGVLITFISVVLWIRDVAQRHRGAADRAPVAARRPRGARRGPRKIGNKGCRLGRYGINFRS